MEIAEWPNCSSEVKANNPIIQIRRVEEPFRFLNSYMDLESKWFFYKNMKKFIVAEKLQMSQIFDKDGKVVPVTILKCGPNKVTQVKTLEKDKYIAIQVGSGRKKNVTKALAGHTKNGHFGKLTEFRVDEAKDVAVGQEIRVDVFV